MSVRHIIGRISHLITVHWSRICNTMTINQLSLTFITTISMFLVSLGLTVLLLWVSHSICFVVCISCMTPSSHTHSTLIKLKPYKTCSPWYSLHSYITTAIAYSHAVELCNIVGLHPFLPHQWDTEVTELVIRLCYANRYQTTLTRTKQFCSFVNFPLAHYGRWLCFVHFVSVFRLFYVLILHHKLSMSNFENFCLF